MATNTYSNIANTAAEAITMGLILYQVSATTVGIIDDSTQINCIKTLPLGVSVRDCSAGDPVEIQDGGIVKCLAGGTIAIGDRIMPKASAGSGIAYAKTGLTDKDVVYIVGYARSAASSGGYFDLEIKIDTFVEGV